MYYSCRSTANYCFDNTQHHTHVYQSTIVVNSLIVGPTSPAAVILLGPIKGPKVQAASQYTHEAEIVHQKSTVGGNETQIPHDKDDDAEDGVLLVGNPRRRGG